MRWPPLIDAGHLPRWVVVRDTVATLFAWGVLLYVIRDLPWMAAYYALRVLGVDVPPPWPPGEMVRDTLPFLKVVALLVLWLVTFAVARWHALTNRENAASQPEALEPAQQAEAFGVTVDVLRRLQAASSCTVHGVDPQSGRGGPNVYVTEESIARSANERAHRDTTASYRDPAP